MLEKKNEAVVISSIDNLNNMNKKVNNNKETCNKNFKKNVKRTRPEITKIIKQHITIKK